MDVLDIKDEILKKIKRLEKAGPQIFSAGKKKAETEAAYNRAIGITIAKLKNGVEFELEGNKVVSPPASYTKDIAKSICWQEEMDASVAASEYKATLDLLDSLKTILVAYQSLLRRFDNA